MDNREDLTKVIILEFVFQNGLMLNKYEPVHEKTNNLGSDQVQNKPECIVTEDS